MWVLAGGLVVLGWRGRWVAEVVGSMHGGGWGERVVLMDLEFAVLVGGGWFGAGMGGGRRLIVLSLQLMLPWDFCLAYCDWC